MIAPNHKRILRNTGMLYLRMLLVMGVTLYTSRVVLAVLGVEDFGLYHVVVGFVALLGFMQGAMTSATQRYFAFDIGATGGKDLNRTFNTSLMIHGLLALLIVLLAETAGYWFVSTQLTIPAERTQAALWAYHLAIASFAVSVITVPFTAMLMAHERMGTFAAIGMVDVLLKLAAVFILQAISSDKLIAYAALLLLVSIATLSLYAAANKVMFPKYIQLHWKWHPEQFRAMLGYTGWNTWGNLAAAMSGQGSNVLLNIFFGPAVNAAKSISAQANGALTNFVTNVQTAINPQIIKLYASGNKRAMHSLVQISSKYNFFLLFTLGLPVFFNTEILLRLWLIDIPPYAEIFLQLTIAASLIDSLAGPLMTSAQATGRIRMYQAIIGGILLSTTPISYIALQQWRQPELVLIVFIAINAIAFIARLIILRTLIHFDIEDYIIKVIARSTWTAAAIVTAVNIFEFQQARNFNQLIQYSIASFLISIFFIITLGLATTEKRIITNALINLKSKIHTR